MEIRDRIKELRRVRAGDLEPHPRNWRMHPLEQREAMSGLLAEVGYADALLARELPDGRLQLVDGHLRAETTPDAVVPVLVLDVSEEEADKILLTHDPLAAMAETNHELLRELIEETQFQNQEVVEMLGRLAESAAANFEPEHIDPPAEVDIPEAYQVVVECESEEGQRAFYERMRREGYKCRVLTL